VAHSNRWYFGCSIGESGGISVATITSNVFLNKSISVGSKIGGIAKIFWEIEDSES
jgi:hypothetical protein